MLGYATLAVANFLYIFLKSFQQRNVSGLHYGWAILTNWFLVATELFVMGSIALAAVAGGWLPLVYTGVAMAIGGTIGCTLSMYLHSKYIGGHRANLRHKVPEVRRGSGNLTALRGRTRMP